MGGGGDKWLLLFLEMKKSLFLIVCTFACQINNTFMKKKCEDQKSAWEVIRINHLSKNKLPQYLRKQGKLTQNNASKVDSRLQNW